MSVTVAVGTHWGDEGKAKVVDYLSEKHDIVVRFQGGANAGHTVIVDDAKWIFHQIPVGILHPDKTCVVGNGVVFDPAGFIGELDELAGRGIDADGRLWISDRAALVMPHHKRIEEIREEALGEGAIGTTRRGIGPTYLDKISREHGMRVGDMLHPDAFSDRLRRIVRDKNEILARCYDAEPLDAGGTIDEYLEMGSRLAPMIADTSSKLHGALEAGDAILCEGAQATLLDIDHGTYPFVTSSNTSAGGACTGTGIGPTAITEVVGIVKAYTSRVGNGPFPTEFDVDLGNRMRELWDEYGATTRRPRRCGWLDGVILRYSARVNGLTGLALTALDRLDTLGEVRVCTGYLIDGTPATSPPSRNDDFERAEPVFDVLPGWQAPTTEARALGELPDNAQRYVRRIEEIAGVPVVLVGVGPGREHMVDIAANA